MFPVKIWWVVQGRMYKKKIRDVEEWEWLVQSVIDSAIRQVMLMTRGMRQSKRQTCPAQAVKALTVNYCCLLECIAELNIWETTTCITAISTSVHVCHVLIHYLHCFSELKFKVQQLSLNILRVFYLQLHGYNCSKFHSDQFRSVWHTLCQNSCTDKSHSRFIH